MATVSPIEGGSIKANRVVKLYRWDLAELGKPPGDANLSDAALLELLNGYERVYAVLGENAVAVDGAINWNHGNKGIVMEALPPDSEFFDVKEGLYRSRNANWKTVAQFKAAVQKLIDAGIYHHDLHVAILKDGSVKFYDSDLAAPATSPKAQAWGAGAEPFKVMDQIRTAAVKILTDLITSERGGCLLSISDVAK